MTVILDPGNDPNSYSDAASRPWKTTAGLWKTDANDTVGQNGDSLGNQLWRTTASTWHTRANTAYDSGTWGTGNTWQTNANTAYDSGVWGTGSTWQARYNSEVTLYNNEVTAYNAALAAGSGATPEETSRSLSSGGPSGGAVWSGSSGAVTRTGHYIGVWTFAPNSSNTPNGQIVVYLRKNSVQQGSSYTTACPNGLQTTYNGWAEFDATNGDTIDLFCSSQTGSNGSSTAGTFKLIYIPTPSNPH